MKIKFSFICLFIIILLAVSACQSTSELFRSQGDARLADQVESVLQLQESLERGPSTDGTTLPETRAEGTFPVTPLFRDFYTFLGGEKTLGLALTPLLDSGDLKEQYVVAGLMVYDPQAPPSDRFRLAPLGREFDVAEPSIPDPREPGQRYVNGHIIYAEFLPFYEALGGARFVGLPLTEARYNPEKGRIEQYFENLGFYRLEGEPHGSVRLLAYGAYACDWRCRYQAPANSIPSRQPPLPEPFASMTARLGFNFLGRTLTEPYEAFDRRQEVIFENLVLVVDQYSSTGVSARPILQLLGIRAQPSVEKTDNPLMIFYPVKGDRGYHIPIYFLDYLSRHGGLEISGPPIGEPYFLENGVFRQCYANLCLDFDTHAEEEKLKPVPLGRSYKKRFYTLPEPRGFSTPASKIYLRVWESQPFVSSGQVQEIHVAVFEGRNPLRNREPVLIVTLPDGNRRKYYFPPTDPLGQSSISLPLIVAPNWTLIAYQVCLLEFGEEIACVGDNYLIWNKP